ncbi:MAG TPA: protoglobin domain-containing protein [Gaiellales bacterium]|nr:protoglobin domain-containing protein [Gaiellales bacterium]
MAATRQRVHADDLADSIGLGSEELAMRKRFLEFDDDDVQRLEGMYGLTHEHVDAVIEAFYEHLLSFPETTSFFRDPRLLEHVKGRQKNYFIRLTQGDYDHDYVTDRLRLGSIHERIGLPVRSFLGMYAFYLRQIAALLVQEHPGDPEHAFQKFHSLTKLLFFDIGLGVDMYIHQRERTIAVQQDAIRELSTPVLTIRDRLLVLPIIGILDTSRAQQLTEELLRSIRESRAQVVILDVTGVPAVDSAVANHLLQTVEASRLMGAQVIVTGLSASVAQALVTLGVDLTKLNAVGDLQGGIEVANGIMGYQVVAIDDTIPEVVDAGPDPEAG